MDFQVFFKIMQFALDLPWFLKSAFLHDFQKTHAICLEKIKLRKSFKKKHLVKCFLSIYHTTEGGMIDRLLGFTSWRKKGIWFWWFWNLKFRKSAILEIFLRFVDLKSGFLGILRILWNPDKFHFCQYFFPTEGGGCLRNKSGVPNACLEYMRRGKILRKAGSFIKL